MDCSHIQFYIHESERPASAPVPKPTSTPFTQHRTIDLNQLQDLFQAAAFWAADRRHEDLAIAIAHSNPVVTVWNGQQLIGFARATSDGIYRAVIWDVIIHPDYQGMGLGQKLVETVLTHPHVHRAERIYLMTTHQQSFYERIGFQPNTSTTMVLHSNPLTEFSTLNSTLQTHENLKNSQYRKMSS